MSTNTVALARKTRYTPWLNLVWGCWLYRDTDYVCANRLCDYFNLGKITEKTRIRFRISQESQGDDYEVIDAQSLPQDVGLRTRKGDEYSMLFIALGRYLYRGCWIGLERMD